MAQLAVGISGRDTSPTRREAVRRHERRARGRQTPRRDARGAHLLQSPYLGSRPVRCRRSWPPRRRPTWATTTEVDGHRGTASIRGRCTLRDDADGYVAGRHDLAERTTEVYEHLMNRHIVWRSATTRSPISTPRGLRRWHAKLAKAHPTRAATAYRLLAQIMRSAQRASRRGTPGHVRGAAAERAPERPVASIVERTAWNPSISAPPSPGLRTCAEPLTLSTDECLGALVGSVLYSVGNESAQLVEDHVVAGRAATERPGPKSAFCATGASCLRVWSLSTGQRVANTRKICGNRPDTGSSRFSPLEESRPKGALFAVADTMPNLSTPVGGGTGGHHDAPGHDPAPDPSPRFEPGKADRTPRRSFHPPGTASPRRYSSCPPTSSRRPRSPPRRESRSRLCS